MMMKNMLVMGLLSLMNATNVSVAYAQMIPGSDTDEHGCIASAGYSWCDATNTCVRSWVTPCTQVDPQFAIDPIPVPLPVSLPATAGGRCASNFCESSDCPQCVDGLECVAPVDMMCAGTCYGTCRDIVDIQQCSDVMCDMYCPNDFQVDDNGCPMCVCNEGEQIPTDCLTWYDGCNHCAVQDGTIQMCTMMMCFAQGTPQCLGYEVDSGH